MPAYIQSIPVRFRDIDALDHVNHAVLLTYCETVRCDWFQGLGYPSMANLPFIIASAHIEYKAQVPKTAEVRVRMWVSRFGSKSWDFDYEVHDGATGEVFATAKTVQVAYDYRAKATMLVSGELRAQLEGIQTSP